MLEWCMSHPWFTFWIVLVALLVIDNVIANLANLANNCMRINLLKSGRLEELLKMAEEDSNG